MRAKTHWILNDGEMKLSSQKFDDEMTTGE